MRYRAITVVGMAVLVTVAGITGCGKSNKPSQATLNDLAKIDAMPSGPARTKLLYDGAKKEGSLTWYTLTIQAQLADPMAKAFEADYPGVTVKDIRPGGASETVNKMIAEHRSDAPVSDVWDGPFTSEALKSAGGAERYSFPTASAYPSNLKDPDGYWVAESLYVFGGAYNTKQITSAQAPKTLQDLLNPAWKGKLYWTTDPTGSINFIGNVLKLMGNTAGMNYLTQLSKQGVHTVSVSARQLVNEVDSGQAPIALQIYNTHVAIDRAKKLPVAYTPLGKAVEIVNPVGLTNDGPHPYAARLFIDFMLSPAGQQIFNQAGYIPASPAVKTTDPSIDPARAGFSIDLMTPKEMAAGNKQWTQIYNQLFTN